MRDIILIQEGSEKIDHSNVFKSLTFLEFAKPSVLASIFE